MEQNKETKIRKFFEDNFGKEIVNSLLEKEKLQLKKGNCNDLYIGSLNKNNEQVLKIVNKRYSEVVKEKRWVFDFPGWIGNLKTDQDSLKEILVVGLEPHINCERTAQVTYGLRETGNLEYDELYEYKSNTSFWKNLNSIFGQDENIKNRKFLEKFYITDMCHFAELGEAKEVNKIKEWKRIREENAEKYFLKTLELIKPKYVVSQGAVVSKFIDKLLTTKNNVISEIGSKEFTIDFNPRFKNFPNLKCYEFDQYKLVHIKVPHIASGHTAGYWLNNEKHIEKKNEKIKEFREKLLQISSI